MKQVICILVTICAIIIAFIIGKHTAIPEQYHDTTYVTEYVTIIEPVFIYDTIIKYKSYKNDTIIVYKDSDISTYDSVILPISARIYNDSTYTAYISGFDCTLDSIKLYNTTKIIQPQCKKSPIFVVSLGVGLGYSISNHKIEPTVGLQVGINLRRFVDK